MKVLNIAYFLSVKTDYLGGADYTLFKQALLMNTLHNVTVILPCGARRKVNARFLEKCKEAGLSYEVFNYEAAFKIRSINLIDYKDDIERIEQFILKKKIDILHSVQINPSVEYVSRKYHIPHVMNIYSLEEWEWNIPYLNIYPQYISSDSIFFLQKWKAYLRCKGECVRVYDDIGIQKIPVWDKSTIVMGAAGTICAYKNQLEIIKAVEFEIKRGKKIQLILAGDDTLSYAGICRDYIVRHHLQDDIHLLGFVENMRDFFEKIDVFICGSRRESFPASIVEAVSCNIPVISTPVAGVPEILEDRKNAYLSGGYSAEKLAEAVENYCNDYEMKQLDGILANEAETYRQWFSAEAVKRQLEKLYTDMLDNFTETVEMDSWNTVDMKLTLLANKMNIDKLEYEDKKRIYGKLLYLYQVKHLITARECYIWGAGKWGKLAKIMIEYFMVDMQIRAFVDSHRKGAYEGIRVIEKESMNIQKDTAVFIAFSDGQYEIIEYLQNMNMEILKNIFIIT